MDSIIVLFKLVNDVYEITKIYEDGTVESKKSNSNEKKHTNIDFIDELKTALNDALELMKKVYDNEKNDEFCVRYNNHDFYSFDLYLDIMLMIKNNEMKKLSIYEKYNQKIKADNEKKQRIIIQKKLEELEANKNKINIENVDSTINDERNIISFNLIKKDNFELGETRFFSDYIDINENIELPEYLDFVGQINLNEMSKYDINNLLPKSGMLYFYKSPLHFNEKHYDFGKVIYADLNENLVRKKLVLDKNNPKLNYGINNIKNCSERFSDRYTILNGEMEYHFFQGEELNKIYGFYTDCQMDDEDIKKISNKYVVLLQLGCEIYGEGVTTFLISEEDLKNKNFNNIIFQYVQS